MLFLKHSTDKFNDNLLLDNVTIHHKDNSKFSYIFVTYCSYCKCNLKCYNPTRTLCTDSEDHS